MFKAVLLHRYRRGETTTDAEVHKVNELIAQWRERLTDISWLMCCPNDKIEFTFDFTEYLFPRLADHELLELRDVLSKDI